jgi:hypothetical protein
MYALAFVRQFTLPTYRGLTLENRMGAAGLGHAA